MEVGEIEAWHHNAADQAGLGTMSSGSLPVSGGHQQLRVLACLDIRPEQDGRRAVPIGTELQRNRAAAMVQP